jgi:hypothetical protein
MRMQLGRVRPGDRTRIRTSMVLAVAAAGVALVATQSLAAGAQAPASSAARSPATSQVALGHHHHGRPGGHIRELLKVRAAMDKYHNIAIAQTDGWSTLFTDTTGATCIVDQSVPSEGAMGYHFVNGANVGSSDPMKPAALVYRPDREGTLHLAALEYLIVEPEQATPPRLFGQEFMFSPPNNQFMADSFYSLHVWLWYPNPDGLFGMWNPRVHCPA